MSSPSYLNQQETFSSTQDQPSIQNFEGFSPIKESNQTIQIKCQICSRFVASDLKRCVNCGDSFICKDHLKDNSVCLQCDQPFKTLTQSQELKRYYTAKDQYAVKIFKDQEINGEEHGLQSQPLMSNVTNDQYGLDQYLPMEEEEDIANYRPQQEGYFIDDGNLCSYCHQEIIPFKNNEEEDRNDHIFNYCSQAINILTFRKESQESKQITDLLRAQIKLSGQKQLETFEKSLQIREGEMNRKYHEEILSSLGSLLIKILVISFLTFSMSPMLERWRQQDAIIPNPSFDQQVFKSFSYQEVNHKIQGLKSMNEKITTRSAFDILINLYQQFDVPSQKFQQHFESNSMMMAELQLIMNNDLRSLLDILRTKQDHINELSDSIEFLEELRNKTNLYLELGQLLNK